MICLLPEKVTEFREALKNKDLNLADLINMTSEQRTEILRTYAGENAKAVNTLFEEKLVLKNRLQGLKNWASKMGEIGKYSKAGKADLEKTVSEYRSAQNERIFSPKQNEAFLNDLADKRIGVHISRDVASEIFKQTSALAKLKADPGGLAGVSDAYLNAKQNLDEFIAHQEPLSAEKSIVQNLLTIGRNNLLMNPATPLKTTTGQIVNSVMEGVMRRLSTLSAGGSNSELVGQANKEAWETFKKTGINTAGMESLDDMHIMNSGENFRAPSGVPNQGKALRGLETVVRKTAQVSNKIAIDIEHVGPFTKFYQKTFFDTANIAADGVAKQEGLVGDAFKKRSGEIFRDAVRVEPKTPEGAMVRSRAQQQSARVTSTNDTLLSRFSVGTKDLLNKIAPGIPIGDFVLPIAKIPATIIANGLDNAGLGLPQGIYDAYKGRIKMASSDPQIKYEGMAQFANGMQRIMRIVGTLGVAAYLTTKFGKDDFRSDVYGNHFLKIGNLWINMEYISALSPALAGMLSAKFNAAGPEGKIGQYFAGALTSVKNVPGIDDVSTLVTDVSNSNFAKGIVKYADSFFTSRGEPAFMQNLFKNRPIDRLFFGATGVETTQNVSQDNADAAAKRKKK